MCLVTTCAEQSCGRLLKEANLGDLIVLDEADLVGKGEGEF